MAYRIGKIKVPQVLIFGDNDEVIPQIIISGSVNESLYDDVTSISNWDIYGLDFFNDIHPLREEIKELVDSIGWSNLPTEEKVIASKYFTVDKDKRDEILTDSDQKGMGKHLFERIKKQKSGVGEILYNKTSEEVTNFLNNSEGELFNYKELNETFDGSVDAVWHEITIPAEPNTVVMVSVRNTSSTRYGGVREVGSELDRKSLIKANSSFTLPVKVNSESKIEVYRQNNKVKFHVTAQLS